MKLTTFLILLSVGCAFASKTYSQTKLLNLKLEKSTVRKVLSEIENQSDFCFMYSSKLIDVKRKVSVRFEDQKIEKVLNSLFKETDVSYVIKDRFIVLTNKARDKDLLTGRQQKSISGKVTDAEGQPLPGVTVLLKGTIQGTITDADGNYTFSNVSGDATLVFSFVGMKTQEIPVAGKTIINVTLAEDAIGLDEVVAIGYGTQKKRDVIGSISTIKSSDLERVTTSNSLNGALQGLAAGVMVTSQSGVPGAPVSVLVRGVNSISSGVSPLWIMDGIPISGGSSGKNYNGETSQNVMSLINPADVESIEVLKDAAATAIYGSRGSNGVILITTKSGKKGEPKVNVSVKTGISKWANSDIGHATGAEYIEIMDRAYANSGRDGVFDPMTSLNQLDGMDTPITRQEALATDTNWTDVISRTGSFIQADVSISGGMEKTNSYLSLHYRKENSILKYGDFSVFSANAKLSYELLNALKIDYRGYVSYSDNNRIKSDGDKAGAGGWSQTNAYSLPWMKVYDENGINGFWNPLSGANALAGMSTLNSESNLQMFYVLQALNGTLQLFDGLTLKGELGVTRSYNKGLSWQGEGIRIDGSIAKEDVSQSWGLNYNSYLTYDKTVGKDHWVNVVAGVENTRGNSYGMGLKSESLIGIYHEVGSAEEVKGSTGLGAGSYLRGYFARANYKFKDKYIVGASIRRDGISKFTPEHRWATFLSGSVGWIISDESFFNVEAINLLKLRGSYGQTGNTNVPGGIADDVYSVTSKGTMDRSRTKFQVIGNSDIRWETTSTTDFGFDFGILNNRIGGSVAYYYQSVKDMILAVNLPVSAGVEGGNYAWQNIGDMENKGFELDIDASILNGNDLKWNLGFNFATNINKVLALDPVSDVNNVGIMGTGPEDRVFRITKTGLPLGTWYMAESAGVDPDKGIPMIYEVQVNENGTTFHTGNIIPGTSENLENNRMILDGKTSLPKIVGGMNSQLSYKNFDLTMNFSFAAGHYIYNRVLQSSLTPNRGVRVLSNRLLTEAWQQPGDDAKWPRVVLNVQHNYDNEGNPTDELVTYGSEEKFVSSMYLEKGDYIKLNNLTIGYTLPAKAASRLKMKHIRIALTATNLLSISDFSGYNPEASGIVQYNSMPQARVFSLGLNVNF